MRKARVFIAFLMLFSVMSAVSHASDTIPLSCMHKKTYLLHISNVIKGCEKSEVSLARQKILFANAIRKYGSVAKASRWVSPPYVSHHPWGVAIDVNYPDEPVGAGWLELHGFKFGLCRVFENEWWHFEPVIAPGWKCPKLVPDATYSVD